MNANVKLYILVNKDLKMSTGKLAVSASHALRIYLEKYQAFSKYINGKFYTDELYQQWMNYPAIIILKAKESLLLEIEKLKNNRFGTVRDLGIIGVPPYSLTAICLGIGEKEKFFQDLKLQKQFKRCRLL